MRTGVGRSRSLDEFETWVLPAKTPPKVTFFDGIKGLAAGTLALAADRDTRARSLWRISEHVTVNAGSKYRLRLPCKQTVSV